MWFSWMCFLLNFSINLRWPSMQWVPCYIEIFLSRNIRRSEYPPPEHCTAVTNMDVFTNNWKMLTPRNQKTGWNHSNTQQIHLSSNQWIDLCPFCMRQHLAGIIHYVSQFGRHFSWKSLDEIILLKLRCIFFHVQTK